MSDSNIKTNESITIAHEILINRSGTYIRNSFSKYYDGFGSSSNGMNARRDNYNKFEYILSNTNEMLNSVSRSLRQVNNEIYKIDQTIQSKADQIIQNESTRWN